MALLTKEQLTSVYLGSFTVPGTMSGTTAPAVFAFSDAMLAFNPAKNSLFISGYEFGIAEIAVPTALIKAQPPPVTQILQSFFRHSPPNWPLAGKVRIGGLLVDGNRLIVSVYKSYDGDGSGGPSHFVLDSLDLKTAKVTGLFGVEPDGGYTGGYMCHVPPVHQASLGKRCLTGLCGIDIISRTSMGPGVFGFDPDELRLVASAPTTDLVHYPFWHGGWHEDDHPICPVGQQSELWNESGQIRGVAVLGDSVVFFGSLGVGPFWYGPLDPAGTRFDHPDPVRRNKGSHGYPYRYQAWAYRVSDLQSVRHGLMEPWQVQPHDVWALDMPYPPEAAWAGGVAYDPATRRLFVAQPNAYSPNVYDRCPVIHVYEVNVGTPVPIPPPPPPPPPPIDACAAEKAEVARLNEIVSALRAQVQAITTERDMAMYARDTAVGVSLERFAVIIRARLELAKAT